MTNPDHIFQSLKAIVRVNILTFFNVMWIRDTGWIKIGSGMEKKSDPGSGMEKSRIRCNHPGSATLNKNM
jgi:hypothetical protein